MIILEETKKLGLNLSLENTFLEKPHVSRKYAINELYIFININITLNWCISNP